MGGVRQLFFVPYSPASMVDRCAPIEHAEREDEGKERRNKAKSEAVVL